MKSKISIDEIIRTSRRTLSLEITTDARVIVRAPRNLKLNWIEKFIFKKRFWIESKQRLQKQRLDAPSPQEFSNTENFSEKGTLHKITERVEWYAKVYGFENKYKSIKLSNARTRWGSCSSKGSLRFNWRLAMAPLEVLDYVVVHELTHLEERHHKKKFWNKVARIFPDYKKSISWLKGHAVILRESEGRPKDLSA